MWISRALFDVHLLPTVRQSFSPSSDTFSEEKGQTDKRRRRHCRRKFSTSKPEAFYVKRTSQFYCPPPTPESDDSINNFVEETKENKVEKELDKEIPKEKERCPPMIEIVLSEDLGNENFEKENIENGVPEIRVRLRKNKKRKHVVAHSEQVNLKKCLRRIRRPWFRIACISLNRKYNLVKYLSSAYL